MTYASPTFSEQYPQHIKTLQKRTKAVLERSQLNALVIHSGQLKRAFLDDYDYPFKVNPHFKAWLPIVSVANCWLIVNGEDKPKLIYYQPVDFWHQVSALTDEFWLDEFEVEVLSQANQVEMLLPRVLDDFAYIGEHIEVAQALGFSEINPEVVLNYLHYHRAYKTEYEMDCIRQANKIAFAGHQAAKAAFLAEASELTIHQAYLTATQQTEPELPYRNIIGLNRHAAILHYDQLNRDKPEQHLALLIDAGAQFHGYAADISRTYAYRGGIFADLINALDDIQLAIVDAIKPGMKYLDLHLQAEDKLMQLLIDFGLVNATLAQAKEQHIIRYFFPHGLGHHLGLQVHDVAGFMADSRGTHIDPPETQALLRTTREIEVNQVLTIEPGIYFIDSLLAELATTDSSALINWQLVNDVKPYGGIRIEDNIIVHQTRNENITREVGL